MPRFVHHVTLQTAHSRPSPRSEVADEVVRDLTPILERALTGEHVGIGVTGYTITAARHGRCCVVTVWGQLGDTARPEPIPILTTGVAGHSRCAATLWRYLHDGDGYELATDPDEVPPTPWCADRIEPGAAVRPEVLEWTGDLSRCLAWTWIELREGR